MSRFPGWIKNMPRYGVKKRMTCSGGCGAVRLHDSEGEARYCDTLKIFKKHGDVREYQTQKQYRLFNKQNDPQGFIKPDFIVEFKDGHIEAHEFKNGLYTDQWRLKAALFTWCYPEITYKVKTPYDYL